MGTQRGGAVDQMATVAPGGRWRGMMDGGVRVEWGNAVQCAWARAKVRGESGGFVVTRKPPADAHETEIDTIKF